MMKVILVESPTKAKTLAGFLGNKYAIGATYGHIRDLPEKKLGIDVEHDFEPEYAISPKQKERIAELNELTKKADEVYLATDPDREGEAISWHVRSVLKTKAPTKRIVFHEITKQAIDEAVAHPRDIDMQLVDAQQARRVVDRLVGYKLSPLLWKKIRRGLSAGRVQSVAVRLVTERERQIEAFKPEEYWNIKVELEKLSGKEKFFVWLVSSGGQKLKVVSKEQADVVQADLESAVYSVSQVEKREISKTPPPPFTTSTLQQNAANKMGWSAKKTMQMAQSLYEEGYISYHRTDSTNLAEEAVKMAKEYITVKYGKEYALDTPRIYKTKSKVAQEAHEAIRPTEANREPHSADSKLNRDQERLYDLVWKRFLGCQMSEARGVAVKVIVEAVKEKQKYGLEAKGEQITFAGWLKLYEVKTKDVEIEEEETQNSGDTGDEKLPELVDGEKLNKLKVVADQKFTQPPSRYNDAGLIKALEEMGIGRPSTYAPILSTIQDRQYVEKVEKRFKPTSLGLAVNDFLVTNFPKIVDYQFTATMENELDEIANGERQWKPVIEEFYKPFASDLVTVAETSVRVKVEVETTGEKCPECHEGDVVIRIGKFGRFLACSRYPECKYKANYQNKIGVTCPKCANEGRNPVGDVIVRRTKSGKTFFGCSNYPNCNFASWTKPHVGGSDSGTTEANVTSSG